MKDWLISLLECDIISIRLFLKIIMKTHTNRIGALVYTSLSFNNHQLTTLNTYFINHQHPILPWHFRASTRHPIFSSLILTYVSLRDKYPPPKLTVIPNIFFLVQCFLIVCKIHFYNQFVRTRFQTRLTVYLADVSKSLNF